MSVSAERMAKAQALKREVFCSGGGRVVMPVELAALAFGISAADFLKMSMRKESLIIQPRGKKVAISLESSIVDWRRDLWDEMLSTLERGRKQTHLIAETYGKVYTQAQTEIFGDNRHFFRVVLFSLFESLPPGMKEVFKQKGQTPENAFSVMVDFGAPSDY